MPNYTFIAETARKLERKAENGKAFPTVHIFYVKFKDLPGSNDDVNKNIPSEVNIRTTDDLEKTPAKKSVYAQLEQSIKSLDMNGEFSPETNLPGYFLYRNSGICITAQSVNKIADKDEKYEIEISDVDIHGIFDGGHTYRTIIENRQKEDGTYYDESVMLQVFTGFERVNEEDSYGNRLASYEIINQIARGQNTTVQVTEDSIADNLNLFQPIKDVLKSTEIADDIAYEQNSNNPIKAKDLTAYLMAMNIKAFPNGFVIDKLNSPPIGSATSTSKPLAEYTESLRSNKDSEYYQLIKRLPEIISLLELIKSDGAKEYLLQSGLDVPEKIDITKKNIWFEKGIEEYGGVLVFGRRREKGKIIPDENKFQYKLSGIKSSIELRKGCFMPILAAFRNMLIEMPDGSINWDGGFGNAIKIWNAVKPQLLQAMITQAVKDNHRSTQLSKHSPLWTQLHGIVREAKNVVLINEDPLKIN